MNILTDALPTSLVVGGQECAINTDFRACLLTMLAFEDNELTIFEKQVKMLENLYLEKPSDIAAATERAGVFLNGGEAKGEAVESPMRLYSFGKDANFIFAAFRQTHGIDLETAELHWWKFLALFMDLGAETTFCSLISLRKRVKSGKATEEEIEAANEMGDVFDVPEPDTRTPEERRREAEFDGYLAIGSAK